MVRIRVFAVLTTMSIKVSHNILKGRDQGLRMTMARNIVRMNMMVSNAMRADHA